MDENLAPRRSDVLMVVDMQYDFMPGGALAVAEGDAILPLVGQIAAKFANVVLTQDWHPKGHASFASTHRPAKPFETKQLHYGDQTLWPDHCVQGSRGARLHEDLAIDHAILILRKGANADVDSYSAFVEADRRSKTGLAGFLREREIRRVFLAGLATDYCVAFSALDALAAGFETLVIADACRAIDLSGSLAAAWARMEAAGARKIHASQIGG
jgi:nicotinamidase/pyrazinamidase